ncbi:MAG: tRNA (adenosine(37)-N6)-threonylcarbamoyltransferase complex dimerization subunit type 1 TsaB [Alphaproteobacteria bacterium]|nr:tRNA (adenosine(37)-N6)-threonylcarbamoyltransferase complex dimerization subunit type 1 TsaB [Alphaproteobacteria bacterium]
MKQLFIQTCIQPYFVALADEKEILAHQECPFPLSRTLFENTDKILTETQIKKTDLSEICVLKGPGSFSGLRTGLAFTKGLAIALNCPAYGLDTFDLYAFPQRKKALIAFTRTQNDAFFAKFENNKIIFNPLPQTKSDLQQILLDNPDSIRYGEAWKNFDLQENNEKPLTPQLMKEAFHREKKDLTPTYGNTCYAKPISEKNSS